MMQNSSSSIIDLHCHSTASDGALAPADVVERARERGVEVLALTDHDTYAGVPEASQRAQALDMILLSGIELSCQWGRYGIHVVGLDFDTGHPAMVEAVNQQVTRRHNRARTIDDRLVARGLPSVLDDAMALAGGVPGRPHFAQAMVDRELVGRTDAAFRRYLGNGKTGDVRACWPELATVVQWITAAGGVAVLAHPRKYRMTNVKLRGLISDFMAAGGQAIEVISSGQSDSDTGYLGELCERFECAASLGSDFHAPGRPWCELGRLPALSHRLRPVWRQFSAPTRDRLATQAGL